jgi:uncharacterized protein YyaL (SSP411 family)
LEDYAFLIAALLDIYEARFDPKWLREAFQRNDRVVELFWDKANGGLFFNRYGETVLPAAIKEVYDGPIPSGNSIAAQNLLLIVALTDNEELRILAYTDALCSRFLSQQSYASRNSKSKDRRGTGICSRDWPAFSA